MANFAKINKNKIVEEIIVINDSIIEENGNIDENNGINFLKNLFKTNDDIIWKLTKEGIRKNRANIGSFYDEKKDAFISEKPFNSWILDQETCVWKTPVPYPNILNQGNENLPYIISWQESIVKYIAFDINKNYYEWNSTTLSWELASNINNFNAPGDVFFSELINNI